MGINFSKSSHLWFFGGLIFVSWFLSASLFKLFPQWPNWLESPSPFVIAAILFFLFDKYLWRSGIFKKLGIVGFPNLNGRWKGTQRSSYTENGKNVETESVLEVKQSFSKVSIKAYYPKSASGSVTANFAEIDDEVYLFYTYDNDPNSFKGGTMEKHRGTVKIKKLPKENRLIGCYWNSIKNQGDMKYEFERKDLLGHK